MLTHGQSLGRRPCVQITHSEISDQPTLVRLPHGLYPHSIHANPACTLWQVPLPLQRNRLIPKVTVETVAAPLTQCLTQGRRRKRCATTSRREAPSVQIQFARWLVKKITLGGRIGYDCCVPDNPICALVKYSVICWSCAKFCRPLPMATAPASPTLVSDTASQPKLPHRVTCLLCACRRVPRACLLRISRRLDVSRFASRWLESENLGMPAPHPQTGAGPTTHTGQNVAMHEHLTWREHEPLCYNARAPHMTEPCKN